MNELITKSGINELQYEMPLGATGCVFKYKVGEDTYKYRAIRLHELLQRSKYRIDRKIRQRLFELMRARLRIERVDWLAAEIRKALGEELYNRFVTTEVMSFAVRGGQWFLWPWECTAEISVWRISKAGVAWLETKGYQNLAEFFYVTKFSEPLSLDTWAARKARALMEEFNLSEPVRKTKRKRIVDL